jgi:S1-C subfamily serine protease
VLALAVGGCATPLGTSVLQSIAVETPGCPAARCELSNDRGTWVLAATPGSVTVQTSTSPLRLSCRGPAGQAASIGANVAASPRSGTGPLVGGAVGGAAVGVGLGAAALSFIPVLGVLAVATGIAAGALAGGAVEAQAQALHYPATLTLPMSCSMAQPTWAVQPAFGFQVRTLDAESARAAGLAPPTAGAAERGAVLITQVAAGSAAESAGLRTGDLLLVANGRILQDAAQLELWLRTLPPGGVLVLQLQRDGQLLERSLQRASAP